MIVILIRHGEAKSPNDDPLRGLTDIGKEQVGSVASKLKSRDINIAKIFHSGKKRAMETATILHERVFPDAGLQQGDNLKPNDDINIWKEELDKCSENIVLVGHLPYMGILASLLSNSSDHIFFDEANLLCLEKNEQGNWKILWAEIP